MEPLGGWKNIPCLRHSVPLVVFIIRIDIRAYRYSMPNGIKNRKKLYVD